MTFSSDALVQTITFKAENKASATFEQLGRASEKLGRQLKTSAESVGEAAGAWDKLEASAGKLSTALNGLSPSVGILLNLRTQMSSMATTAGRLSERLDKLAISSAAFADLGNDATKGQRLLTTATDRMMSDFARIKGELTGLKTDKITLGSQMQEQAKLMSEAARSMEVSAGKMRSAERSSSGGSSGGRYGGGSGSPFHSSNFAGRVALGTAGSMAVYAGLGGAGQILGGGDYRQYTTSQARIQGYTGPQGQQIARQAYNQYLTSAPRLGMRPTDAMEGLYFITSSIQNKGQALNLSNAAMRTAAAGGIPVADTAKFITQFANNYGPAMRTRGQINNFANASNQAVRVGTMEWTDLPHIVTPSIGRSAGLGITPQQLLAMAAQLSNRYSPGQAAPMLTNLVSQLNAPIGQQIKTAQVLGLDWMSVRKDLKQGNLQGAVGLMNSALNQGPVSADDIEQRTHGMITGKAAVNLAQRLQTRQQRERTLMGGNRAAMTAFEALFAGGSLPQFNKTLGQVSANQGSVQQSITVRLNSPQGKLDKMVAETEAFKIKIEKELEPLRNLMEKVVSKWTSDVGKHLGGIVKTVKSTFSSFSSGLKIEFPDISKSFGDVKTQLRSIGEALGIVSEKGGPTTQQFKELGKAVGTLAGGVLAGVAGGLHLIHDSLKLIGDNIGPVITNLTGLGKNSKETGSAIENIGKVIGFVVPILVAVKVATMAWSVVQAALTPIMLANAAAVKVAQFAAATYKGETILATVAIKAWQLAQLAFNAVMAGKTMLVAAANVVTYQATAVAASAAVKAWTIAQWALNAAMDANVLSLIIIGIAAVVAGFILAYKNIKPFHDAVNNLFSLLKEGATTALTFFKNHWQDIVGFFQHPLESIKHGITEFGPSILTHITNAVNGVLNYLKNNWKEVIVLAVMGPFGLILAAFKLLPASWKEKAGDAIGGFIKGIENKAGDLANAVKNALAGAIEKAVGVIKGSMPDWVKKILGIDLNAGGKDKSGVNGTGLLATTSSGGGLGPGLGRATLGKNAPFVDSGSELGNYAMFQANKIKYSGALLDYDYGTAPHKVSLPRGSYTYGGQYSLKGMGTFEWFNTQNGGVIGFNHLQSTPNYKPGQHLSGGAKVGISGEPTSPQFGSGYHLCIVTDAKGREYFQWLSTEQMNNVVKAGGGISSRVAGYSSMIQKASKQTGAPVDLLAAIMQTESGGDPTQISPAGALGLMQIMPGNLGHLGVKNWRNAQQNITGGAKLLMEYYRQSGGDWNQALKWYNAGYAHPEKGAGYAKTVLALAHNVGFHGGAGTDPTSFGGKYNAPPPGGWAYGVVGATFEGQKPYSTALDYGPFPVGQPGRTALQHNPMAALAYSRYMGRIENLPTEFQGYLAPQAQKFRDALVAEDRDYTKKRDQRIGQYNKELAGIKQRFGDKRADLLTNEQQAIVYKIAGTDITTDARKKKELQQVISARAAYNTRIANLNAEEQAAKRGDYTKSERDADTDKYKRLRTQATTAFNRKTAGYETDLFGQDQVSKDRLNLYLSHLGVRTTTQGQRISRAEAEAKKALEDKYFGTTGKPGLITALTEGHMGKVAQITQDINKASNPAQIIADLTKDIADKLKKGMDSIVYKLLAGSDGIGKFVKQVADATVAQTKMQNLNDRASMAVEERLAKDKDYTRVLAENARIQARVNLAKQKESDNVLATNLNHESYIKTLAASAMEQQRNTLLQAKQNLAVTQITANSEKYTKSLYETQLANQLSAQLQAKQNVAVTQMTASSDQFTKSLYQTQIANQASAQLQAAQNLVVAQMLAGSTAYTQSLIEMRTIDEANAQLQSATSLRVSTAFTDLAGMAQSVGDILNANIGKWTDSVGKGAGYLNTYTSGLKAAYDEQVALTDADNKRNVILGQVLGDFQRLSSGLQGVFSTSMEKISLWTAMLGRSADGITTTTGDIVKLGVQALKDAGNLASLDDVIAGISSVVSGLKSAAGTDFMRTGSIGAGTIGAYSAAQTSLTQANWDQVATDLTLSRSDKDLPGYMEAVGREIEMWKNKTARDAATFGQHSTQVQQDLDVLKKLQDEAHGLDIAFKRLTDTTLKAPVAPTDPTDTAAFKTYQEDLQAWNDDTAAADAAMVAFASGGVTAAESALQGMTAIINTSATNLSGSLATASSGASSLATTTVTLANAFTSLTSAVAGLLAAINAKGSGSLGGGGGIENAAPGQRQGQGTNGGHTFSVYRDPDTGQTSYVWDDGQVTNSGVYPGARANPYSDGTTPPPADTTSSAYQAGYRAGTIGPSAGLNPYASGTPENQQWNLGMYAGVGSGQHTSVGTDGTTPPPANINSVAYQQGYQAGQTGTGSNPYPPGSDNNRQWNQGMYAGVGAGPAPPPPALVTPPAVIPGAVPIGGPSSALTQGIAQSESMYAPVSGMPGLYYMHADPKNPDQGVYVYTSSNGTQTFYTGDKYKPGTTPKITGNYDISANLGSTDGGGSVGSGATPSAFMSASSDIMGPAWTRQYYGGNTFDPFGNSLDPKVQGGGFGGGGGEVELTATGGPSIMRGTTTTFKPDPYNGDYGVYRYNPLGASFDTSATFDNQDPLYGTMGGIRPASMGGAGFYDSLMKSNVLGILGSTPGGSEIADALKAIAQTSEQTASNTGDIASNISNMDPAEVAKQLRSLLTQVREYEATHGRSIPGLATMGWDEFSRKAGAIATQAGI